MTGANGTLGTEVVAHLRGLGHDVRPHDRDQGDLRSRDVVAAALAGVDAVVHAAAIPEPVSHPPHETFGNNVESTFHVLNLAGAAGIRRVVSVSSASAFGFAWSARGVAPSTCSARFSAICRFSRALKPPNARRRNTTDRRKWSSSSEAM